MEIVVNEWLLDYLRPDAQADETSLAIRFVNAWVEKCDKAVIRRTSPFTRKFYKYMKEFGWNITFKKRFSKLNGLLFRNSDKTRILDDYDVEDLSEELLEMIPSDDRYLIQLWHSIPDSVIVTTDVKLKDSFQSHSPSVKIFLLEDFLQTYFSAR